MNRVAALLAAALVLSACQDPTLPSEAACSQPADEASDFPRFPGDGAQSVPLPDGRTVWLLGDSILSDGKFVNNMAYIQTGACFKPLLGPDRTEWVPDVGARWYWPSDAIVAGNTLRVYASEVERASGGGAFGFRGVDMDVAVFALPSLTFVRMEQTPAGASPTYGVGVEGQYLYGTKLEPGAFGHDVYVARAGSPWKYWDGIRWNVNASSARPILRSVDAALSVDRATGKYRLTTKDNSIFGTEVVAYTSANPQGPFARRVLHVIPDPGPDAFSYAAYAHPEQRLADGGLLVSWNLNAYEGSTTEYGPHFVSVGGA